VTVRAFEIGAIAAIVLSIGTSTSPIKGLEVTFAGHALGWRARTC
jgi:hypothetical protein